MTVFEIEDYNGNTIGAIEVDMNFDGEINILNITGFDVADVEDYDDIFGTTDKKVRLQMNNRGLSDVLDEAEWQADRMDNMVRDTLPDDDYFEMNNYF